MPNEPPQIAIGDRKQRFTTTVAAARAAEAKQCLVDTHDNPAYCMDGCCAR